MPTSKPKSKQLNVRIPPYTQDQLEQIEKKTGMTQTQAVIVAIDRLASSQSAPNGAAGQFRVIFHVLGNLKPLVQAIKRKKPENVTMAELGEAGKWSARIAYDLCLLSQGR